MVNNLLYGSLGNGTDSNQKLYYSYIRNNDLLNSEKIISANPYLRDTCDLKLLLELQLNSFIQKYIGGSEPYDMNNLLKVHNDYKMPVSSSIVNNVDLLNSINFDLYLKTVLTDGLNISYERYKYIEYARKNIVPTEKRFMEIFSDAVRKDIKNPSEAFVDSLATIVAAKLTKDIEEVLVRRLKYLTKNTFISCAKGEREKVFHLLIPGENIPLCESPSLYGELKQSISPHAELCRGCFEKNNLSRDIEKYNTEYINIVFNQKNYNLIQNSTAAILRDNLSFRNITKNNKGLLYEKPKEEIYKTVLEDQRTKSTIRHTLKNYIYGDCILEEDNLIELNCGTIQIGF